MTAYYAVGLLYSQNVEENAIIIIMIIIIIIIIVK